MTSIIPPDGYTVEWGQQMEGGDFLWFGTDGISERAARKSVRTVIRYVSPAIPVQEGDDEPRD